MMLDQGSSIMEATREDQVLVISYYTIAQGIANMGSIADQGIRFQFRSCSKFWNLMFLRTIDLRFSCCLPN